MLFCPRYGADSFTGRRRPLEAARAKRSLREGRDPLLHDRASLLRAAARPWCGSRLTAFSTLLRFCFTAFSTVAAPAADLALEPVAGRAGALGRLAAGLTAATLELVELAGDLRAQALQLALASRLGRPGLDRLLDAVTDRRGPRRPAGRRRARRPGRTIETAPLRALVTPSRTCDVSLRGGLLRRRLGFEVLVSVLVLVLLAVVAIWSSTPRWVVVSNFLISKELHSIKANTCLYSGRGRGYTCRGSVRRRRQRGDVPTRSSQRPGARARRASGRSSGRAPDAAQRLGPAGRDDRVAERLAELVLAHLQVHARAAGRAGRRGPPRRSRRASRRARSSASSRPSVGRAGVHDVLGVPLDHRHRRLQPVERPRWRSGRRARARARRAAARGPAARGSRASRRPSGASACASNPRRRRPRSARRRARACAARATRPARTGSRGCISCSATQRRKSSRSALEAAPRDASMFSPTNSSRGGRAGPTAATSYWPSTRSRRVAGREPRLGPDRRADGAAGDRAERAGQVELGRRCRASSGARGLGEGRERVAPPSSRRSTSSATGGEPDGAEAGVGGGGLDRALARAARPRPPCRGRPRAGRPGLGTPAITASRRRARPRPQSTIAGVTPTPAAAARWTASSVPSISSSSAGGDREARVEVERRVVRQPDVAELDEAPASRAISCAAATSTERLGRALSIPSKRAGGDVTEGDRERADRRGSGTPCPRAPATIGAISSGLVASSPTTSSP